MLLLKKRCIYCNKEFKVRYPSSLKIRKYCSQRCLNLASIIIHYKKCKGCGRVFEASSKEFRERKYCKRKCYFNTRRKFRMRKCEQCGKWFDKKSRVIGRHCYCSRKCCFEYKRSYKITRCKECNKRIKDRDLREYGCCSRLCIKKVRIKLWLKGKESGAIRNGIYIRSYIREYLKRGAGWKCEQCGRKGGKDIWKRLDIHHKDRNPKNNKRSNLQVLCHICHLKKHDKEKKIERG